MSRKIKDFIKIVAALLAVVAVVGLLGSFISDRKGDEDPTDSESVKFEETTEEVIVDHSSCENEHNWSLRTLRTSEDSLTGYGYICGVCNTLIHPSLNFYYGYTYDVFDLSKTHRYSGSTGLTSHFNYINNGDYLYISSKSSGEEVKTSFQEVSVTRRSRYMAIGYRVTDPNARNLVLEIVLGGKTNSFTVAEPFTNGWVYVVMDLSSLNGYQYEKTVPGSSPEIVFYDTIGVSFEHDFTLDVSFISLGTSKEIARNIPGYSGTYYDRGSDFSSIGTPIYAE